MIKVIVADDHELISEGLRKVVSEGSIDIKIVKEAQSAAELLDMLAEELPDLVILDISMPGRSGLDALGDIKDLYPKLPVLILTMHPEHRYATRAIKAGADGYLTKSGISDELITAIRLIVTNKKKYINPEVAEQLALQINVNTDQPLHEGLSDREFEVLCKIASGKKISAIAEELSLSVQTVHTYRTRVKEKMNMKSNVEFTRYALEHGLID